MHLAGFYAAASPTLACCEPFENTPRRRSMAPSRRDFLKGCGALIVSFSATSFSPRLVSAQGPFATHFSHIDPTKLDSWLAVSSDGSVTACTGKCDFGQGIFTAQTQLVAEEL